MGGLKCHNCKLVYEKPNRHAPYGYGVSFTYFLHRRFRLESPKQYQLPRPLPYVVFKKNAMFNSHPKYLAVSGYVLDTMLQNGAKTKYIK
jgi:hypothetical protein